MTKNTKPTVPAKIWREIKRLFLKRWRAEQPTEVSCESRFEANLQILKDHGIVVLSDRDHSIKIKTKEGFTFCIRANSTDIPVVQEFFCEYGYAFKNNRNEQTIVIDVGMNIGISSVYFASMENVKHVFSFEPFTPTYNRALENIKLNPTLAGKITAFSIGLGNENKILEIPYNRDFAGNMSTTIDRMNFQYRDKEGILEKVEVKNAGEILSTILASHSTKRVILKIDTEGAEFDILESLDSAGLLPKIDFVMMEYHFREPQFLEDVLTKNGYIVIYRHYGYLEGSPFGFLYGANIGKQT